MSTTQTTIISRDLDTLEVNGKPTMATSASIDDSPSRAAALLSAALDAEALSFADRPAVALSSTVDYLEADDIGAEAFVRLRSVVEIALALSTHQILQASRSIDLLFERASGRGLSHPASVAANVAASGGSREAIALALLHDLFEDGLTSAAESAGALEASSATLESAEAKALVLGISRAPGETYAEFIARAASHPVTLLVKRHDILHNMLTATPSMAKRYSKALASL